MNNTIVTSKIIFLSDITKKHRKTTTDFSDRANGPLRTFFIVVLFSDDHQRGGKYFSAGLPLKLDKFSSFHRVGPLVIRVWAVLHTRASDESVCHLSWKGFVSAPMTFNIPVNGDGVRSSARMTCDRAKFSRCSSGRRKVWFWWVWSFGVVVEIFGIVLTRVPVRGPILRSRGLCDELVVR